MAYAWEKVNRDATGQKFEARYVLAIPTLCDTISDGEKSGTNDKITRLPRTVDVDRGGVQNPWPNENIAIIPWVTDIKMRPRFPIAVTMTDDPVVERGRNGVRAWDIILSGETESLPGMPKDIEDLISMISDNINATTSEGIDKLDLPASVRLLLGMNRLLFRAAATNGTELHFYGIPLGIFKRVIPGDLVLTHGGRNRTGISYSLTLTAYGDVQPPRYEYIKEVYPLSKAMTIDEFVDAANSAITQANRYIQDGRAFGQKMINKGAKLVDLAFRAAESAVETFKDMIDDVSWLLHEPSTYAQRAKALAGNAKTAVSEANRLIVDYAADGLGFGEEDDGEGDAGSAVVPQPGKSGREMRDLVESGSRVQDAMLAVGVAANVLAGAPQSSEKILIEVDVPKRQKIEDLAASLLGDATAFSLLAELNGIKAPYRLPARIKVPLMTAKASGYVDPRETDEGANLYGVDLDLRDGDLVVTPDMDGYDGAVDFAEIVGVDNFLLNNDIRTTTEIGRNQIYPFSGIPAATGKSQSADSASAYAVALVHELLRDDRIVRVKSVTVEDLGNGIKSEAEVVLVDGSLQKLRGA